MTDTMQAAIEAAAKALWQKHYNYGPGTIGAALSKHWDVLGGQSRREYLADAQTAITAFLKASEEAGSVLVNIAELERAGVVLTPRPRVEE